MTLTYLPKKRSYHKEYTLVKYESPITYHSQVMANAKVVFVNRVRDKQNKKYMARSIDKGHKNAIELK